MFGRPYSTPKAKYMPDHVAALMEHKGTHLMGPPDDAYYVGEAHHNRCINCSQFQRRKAKNYPDAIHGRCAIDQPINGRVYWVEGKMGCPWWTRASALQEAKTIYFSDPKGDAPEIDLSTYLIVHNLKPEYEGPAKTAYDAASAVKEYLGADGAKLYQTTDGGLFASMQVAYLRQLELDGGEIPYDTPKDNTKTKITGAGMDFAVNKAMQYAKAYGANPKKFMDLVDVPKKWTPPPGKYYKKTYTLKGGEIKELETEIISTPYETHFEMETSPSAVLKMLTEKMAGELAAKTDNSIWDELSKYEKAPVSFSTGGKAAGGEIPPLFGGDPVWPKELADLKYGTKMPAIQNIHNIQVTSPNADDMAKVLEAINKDMDKHDALYKALGMKGTPKYPY